MGDSHRCGAHLDHDLADQIVDHPGHDGVQSGCGLVKEDDLGLGGDGASEADTFLHAPRKLGRQAIRHIRFQPDPAQFFNGDLAGFLGGAFQRAAHQAEGHILPDRQRVKQGSALKQHSKAGQKGIAVAGPGGLAIDIDLAAVRRDQPQHAFECDGLTGAGAADDHHRAALGDRKVHAAQDAVVAKGLMHLIHFDHRVGGVAVCHGCHSEKNTPVRMKLVARISTAAASTEDLVALPTPCAPRPDCIP